MLDLLRLVQLKLSPPLLVDPAWCDLFEKEKKKETKIQRKILVPFSDSCKIECDILLFPSSRTLLFSFSSLLLDSSVAGTPCLTLYLRPALFGGAKHCTGIRPNIHSTHMSVSSNYSCSHWLFILTDFYSRVKYLSVTYREVSSQIPITPERVTSQTYHTMASDKEAQYKEEGSSRGNLHPPEVNPNLEKETDGVSTLSSDSSDHTLPGGGHSSEEERERPALSKQTSAKSITRSISEVRDGILSQRDPELGQTEEEQTAGTEKVNPKDGGEEPDPNLVSWEGPDDPENPLNWPNSRKWAAIFTREPSSHLIPLS